MISGGFGSSFLTFTDSLYFFGDSCWVNLYYACQGKIPPDYSSLLMCHDDSVTRRFQSLTVTAVVKLHQHCVNSYHHYRFLVFFFLCQILSFRPVLHVLYFRATVLHPQFFIHSSLHGDYWTTPTCASLTPPTAQWQNLSLSFSASSSLLTINETLKELCGFFFFTLASDWLLAENASIGSGTRQKLVAKLACQKLH